MKKIFIYLAVLLVGLSLLIFTPSFSSGTSGGYTTVESCDDSAEFGCIDGERAVATDTFQTETNPVYLAMYVSGLMLTVASGSMLIRILYLIRKSS